MTALITRRFHWEGYTSPRHMLRSIGGAALMGTGGAMAYGCSVGQGLTGISTLALASFVAVAGILLGSAAGLRGVLRVQPLRVHEAPPSLLVRKREPHHIEIARPHFYPLDQAFLDQQPMRFAGADNTANT